MTRPIDDTEALPGVRVVFAGIKALRVPVEPQFQ